MEALNFFSKLGYEVIQFQPHYADNIYSKVTLLLEKRDSNSSLLNTISDPFRNYGQLENTHDLLLKCIIEEKE